jgi:tRNA-dihydrouridine synthase A
VEPQWNTNAPEIDENGPEMGRIREPRGCRKISMMPCRPAKNLDHRVCIAPMMEWTTRHCRYFMRLLTRRAVLYTEMIPTGALLNGDSRLALAFHPAEHPLAVQLGGSDPAALADCAGLAAEIGYDEVNLNVGCPSDRVQSARFGACLMAEPDLVADCVAAMREAVLIPVTVKTRLGIDDHDSYEALARLIAAVAAAGCESIILHARKAWLQGLSPEQNRNIPPLDYASVYRVKRDFPQLEIVINGGLATYADIAAQLEQVDGVMIGRAAYQNPWLLAEIDRRHFGDAAPERSREAVLRDYRAYLEEALAEGVNVAALTRHLLGLFHGQAGARRWRRTLSEAVRDGRTGAAILDAALAAVRGSERRRGPRCSLQTEHDLAFDVAPEQLQEDHEQGDRGEERRAGQLPDGELEDEHVDDRDHRPRGYGERCPHRHAPDPDHRQHHEYQVGGAAEGEQQVHLGEGHGAGGRAEAEARERHRKDRQAERSLNGREFGAVLHRHD